mgnify:CR=1 FL=1
MIEAHRKSLLALFTAYADTDTAGSVVVSRKKEALLLSVDEWLDFCRAVSLSWAPELLL